jgi:uncharacterized protein (DUF2336 family)
LLRLARDRSEEGRKRLVTIIGDLFFLGGIELSAQERALMSDILRKLIRDVSAPIRRILAEKLAHSPDAPREIVVELANDEFAVAEAILMKSEVLRDPELIEIVYHRSLQHQLAVAMRRGLSDAVSDALVDTGNVDVIQTLLGNQEAHISEPTMAYLVDQSRTVDSFQEPILRRGDLSTQMAQKMYFWVSAALRQQIVERFGIDSGELDQLIEATVEQSLGEDEDEREAAGPASPDELAHQLEDAGMLTPQLLIQTLRQGEIPLFEALLARMTGLRQTLIRRFIYEPGGECLAVICRALNIEKPTFASIFLLTRRSRPSERMMKPQDLTRLLGWFDRVDAKAAETVMARWRRSPELLYAIKRIEDSSRGAHLH